MKTILATIVLLAGGFAIATAEEVIDYTNKSQELSASRLKLHGKIVRVTGKFAQKISNTKGEECLYHFWTVYKKNETPFSFDVVLKNSSDDKEFKIDEKTKHTFIEDMTTPAYEYKSVKGQPDTELIIPSTPKLILGRVMANALPDQILTIEGKANYYQVNKHKFRLRIEDAVVVKPNK